MAKKRILMTGAGSGFGRATAWELARKKHEVIAAVEVASQIADLRREAEASQLTHLRVEKLDLLDPFDVQAAADWDFDILVNNAAVGEGGPIAEMPLELIRRNFEVNVFKTLELTQQVVRKWVTARRPGKIVFVSSVAAIIAPPGLGAYGASKHAIQAIAEVLHQELQPFDIQVQTINPGPYATGFNEGFARSAFRWHDQDHNFTPKAAMKAAFEQLFRLQQDPRQVVAEMARIIPLNTGKFRNIVRAEDETFYEQREDEVSDAPI